MTLSSPLLYFTDPVLQAPMIGSMLMCVASALMGVIVFLRKRSLLGETLSHASYPGVVLALFFAETLSPSLVLASAFASSLLGLWVMEKLEKRFAVKEDAALCVVLALFLGVGITLASYLQTTHPMRYRTIQTFLYGQAATMTDAHLWVYASLVGVIIISLLGIYRQMKVSLFDREFAKSLGFSLSVLDLLLFVLLTLAIVIGIRSVGVVLMAGMLIAPVVAARQFTHSLWRLFLLSALFGLSSGFMGNYLSVELPSWKKEWHFTLPTGPMILLSSAFLCFLSLFFAPDRGIISRKLRSWQFRQKCLAENLLKYLWRQGGQCFAHIYARQGLSYMKTRLLLAFLVFQGWIEKDFDGHYLLSQDGKVRAKQIVRLHRLWEAYLVYLGQEGEKVHLSAEEMEHVLTPELEHQLAELLKHPQKDPHHQPIPPAKEFL